MRNHLSVFMLMARSTICRVLGLLAVMAAAETGLFWFILRRGVTGDGFSLELLIGQSHIALVFGAVFLLITALLTSTGYESSGKQTYTLMRLSVSSRWVFFWQSVYNVVCYLLLWAAQVLTVMLICRLYVSHAPKEYVTGQTVFLAFYRNDFLHSLLPFEEAVCWARNAAAAAALGICAAHDPRAGAGISKKLILLAAVTVFLFVREIGDAYNCAAMIIVSLAAAAHAVYRVFEQEAEHEA